MSSFQTKKEKLTIIYYENNDLRGIQPSTKAKQFLGTNVKPQYSDLHRTDNLVFTASEIGVEVPDNWLFYIGFVSPYEGEVLYMQTEKFDFGYQVFSYNESTGEQTPILQTGDGPNAEHVYVPFGYTDNPDVIYVEAVHLPSQSEHLGIWTYNLKTGEFSELFITDNYMRRPVLSPDRTELYYVATSSYHRDVVHGLADKIMSYDTKSDIERLVVQASDKQLSIQGLFIGDMNKLEVLGEEIRDESSPFEKAPDSGFKLPWNDGKAFCTTRDGTPRPPVSSLNNGGICNYGFSQHGYRALDFSDLNTDSQNSQDYIRAAREGEVIYAGYQGANCTYGNLVKLLHADGLISYYAHLSSINVSVGECVGQGQIVGREGATGGESCGGYGEHLHFEVRTSNSGGSQVWVTFDEYGQTTRQNDLATSDNTPVACGGGSCPANNTITGTISAGTYETSSSITSTGTVNSGTVTFRSPIIYLNDGFTVSGGIFYAQNASCSSNVNAFYNENLNYSQAVNKEAEQSFYDFSVEPNPFGSYTQIKFALSEEVPVTIWITNMMGSRITTLANRETKSAGEHQVIFEAANYSTGMYFANIQAGTHFGTQKMILTR